MRLAKKLNGPLCNVMVWRPFDVMHEGQVIVPPNFLETSGEHHLFMFLSHYSKLTFFLIVKLFAVLESTVYYVSYVFVVVFLFGAMFIVD